MNSFKRDTCIGGILSGAWIGVRVKIYFHISEIIHMLWVLKRTVSMRRFI